MRGLARWSLRATALLLATPVVAGIIALPFAGTRVSGEAIIPPGREAAVSALLGPLLTEGFLGWSCESVQIHRTEVRLQLGAPPGEVPPAKSGVEAAGCGGVDWARWPGGLTLRYHPTGPQVAGQAPLTGERRAGGLALTFHLCAEARDLDPTPTLEADRQVTAMAARHEGGIWREANVSASGTWNAGMLSGPADLLGLPPGPTLALILGLGLLAALGAGLLVGSRARRSGPLEARDPSSPAAPLSRPWVAALLLLCLAGVGLRIWSGATQEWDVDETWAVSRGNTPLLNRDHDAWVHPPLYRIAQQTFSDAIGWEKGDALLLLRLPSVLALSLALCLLGLAALRFRARPAVLLLLGVVAVSPELASAGVLARPYALATALGTLGMLALWPGRWPGSLSALDRGVATFVAVLALGLTAWTDLPLGVAVCALAALRLFTAPRHATLGGAGGLALVVALALFCAPLLPAGLDAVRSFTAPEEIRRSLVDAPDAFVPDLRPGRRAGQEGPSVRSDLLLGHTFFGHWEGGVGATIGGLALLLLALGLALRRRRWFGLGLPLLLALAYGLSFELELEPRNLLFLPHLVLLFLLWIFGRGESHQRSGASVRGPAEAGAQQQQLPGRAPEIG